MSANGIKTGNIGNSDKTKEILEEMTLEKQLQEWFMVSHVLVCYSL